MIRQANKEYCEQLKGKPQMLSGGFTLVEIIIAILILSVVALIISSGFRLGIEAWEKGGKEIDEIQKYRTLYGLMSQQIKSAHPYKIKIENESFVIFRGGPDFIMFAISSNDRNFKGFKWIRYEYKEGELLYMEGVLPDKKIFDIAYDRNEVLESKIGEVTFSYLSSDDGEWKESWDMGDNLPGAVTLKLGDFEPMLVYLPLSKMDEESVKNNGSL